VLLADAPKARGGEDSAASQKEMTTWLKNTALPARRVCETGAKDGWKEAHEGGGSVGKEPRRGGEG